jgi:hypothetical protein
MNTLLKLCVACNSHKPVNDFYKNNNKCKICFSVIYKKYYNDNRSIVAKRMKKYKVNHISKTLWLGARKRARERGLPFNIEESDIIIPEFCPALGMRLVCNNCKVQDNSPTLDRVIPELGYTKGNVEVISWRANKAKGNASIEELEKLIVYIKKSLKKTS